MVYEIKSIFDWSNIPGKLEKEQELGEYRTSLFNTLKECIDNGYAFMPYAFYKACEDKLEQDKIFAVEGHFECFKLKEGETIKICAG